MPANDCGFCEKLVNCGGSVSPEAFRALIARLACEGVDALEDISGVGGFTNIPGGFTFLETTAAGTTADQVRSVAIVNIGTTDAEVEGVTLPGGQTYIMEETVDHTAKTVRKVPAFEYDPLTSTLVIITEP